MSSPAPQRGCRVGDPALGVAAGAVSISCVGLTRPARPATYPTHTTYPTYPPDLPYLPYPSFTPFASTRALYLETPTS
jgi:hypothetical protein